MSKPLSPEGTRLYTRLYLSAVVVDAAALLAILLIATFNVWHSGPIDGIERRLIDTWFLWGLIPAFVASFGCAFAGIDREGVDKWLHRNDERAED